MQKLSRCRQTLEKIQPGCTLPPSRKKNNKLSTYIADTTLGTRVVPVNRDD